MACVGFVFHNLVGAAVVLWLDVCVLCVCVCVCIARDTNQNEQKQAKRAHY